MTEESREDNERPPQWGMGDAVGGNLGALVLSLVGVGIALGLTGEETTDEIPLWAVALLQIPLWAGLLAAVLLASRTKGARSLRTDFGLDMRWRDVPAGLAAGFVGQLAIGLVVISVYDLLGIDTDRVGETAEELADRAVGATDVLLLVLVVVVAAPIVEELFYRGLWMRSIERRSGSVGFAVLASSLVFGAVHFQPYDLLALTLAGVLFAVLAVRAGRLGPAIWAHVAFNMTAVVSLL